MGERGKAIKKKRNERREKNGNKSENKENVMIGIGKGTLC
jgi:hypothetical protein